ncbi:MAG: hypothetical protein N4A72_19905 [Bacteroidales bacterium]|jgi:hypothetical protein|nr:hypothetical protein [Bacteroidales bacterium]
MKNLIILLITCVLAVTDNNMDNKLLSVELEFTNVMTGAKAKYSYNDRTIKVFSSKDGNSYKFRGRRKINESIEKQLIYEIDKLLITHSDSVVVFSNPMILDGFTWTLCIEKDSIKRKYIIENCYNENIDNIIDLFNNRLKRKQSIVKTKSFNLF